MKFKSLLKISLSGISVAALTSMSALNAFATDGTASASASAGGSLGGMLISMAVLFVVMYFLFIKPQKKREDEAKQMQENLQIGDEVVTVGGIIGFVVRKGKDDVVIETGGEKIKIRVKVTHIAENTTAREKMEAQKKAAQNQKITLNKDDSKSK